MLAAAGSARAWDIIVIGGGATGLGAAVDAAARGYRTILLEQSDFAKGTSSRSTKLIHGGVRYLRQGNVSLVLEALKERGLLIRNAPHLVHNLSFVVPAYDWWEGPFYGVGMKLYDVLAGKLGLGPSRTLTREETLERIPGVEDEGLRGGTMYYDGQFDDARLAITLARTAAELGATLLNHAPVVRLLKRNGLVTGVAVRDEESGDEFELLGAAVINATGVFVDRIRHMDEPDVAPLVSPSQGVHLVLDRSFQPGDSAVMVPKTDDGRVLFAVPWHERVVVGTTDTPRPDAPLEPLALEDEVEFLLEHAARYLERDPAPSDVLSVFAGLRPLVRPAAESGSTASISREHSITVSPAGLVTITGGKWTTYRRMGQDVIDIAAQLGGLDERPCATEHLRLHGAREGGDLRDPWSVYGSDASHLARLADRPDLSDRIHPRLPYRMAEIVWGVRQEMARTLEDVLSRRTRALLLDARASIEAAPAVAAIMAAELGRDAAWQTAQIDAYTRLARGYLLPLEQEGAA